MTGVRLLIDTSKCIGCKACQVACQQWHSLEAEDTTFTGSYQNPPDMSGANLTVSKFTEKEEVDGKIKWLFFKDQCRHCVGAHCRACPLGAVYQWKGQIVLIDPEKCDPTKCSTVEEKPCQNACPYDIPKWKYEKNGVGVRTKMRKCDFCYNRFLHPDLPAASKKPACLGTCPPGAIYLGPADKMLTGAMKRAKYLRFNGYPKATVYPKQSLVWGPTRVIWVLLDEAAAYGLPGSGY